jgi:hypothetical protein
MRTAIEKAIRLLHLSGDERLALRGVRTILEASAERQRRERLREVLGESGLPLPAQWIIERNFKRADFSDGELMGAIEAERQALGEEERCQNQK